MTWAEFKRRAEELGVEDGDQIGFDSIDDDGRAYFNRTYYCKFVAPARKKGNGKSTTGD